MEREEEKEAIVLQSNQGLLLVLIFLFNVSLPPAHWTTPTDFKTSFWGKKRAIRSRRVSRRRPWSGGKAERNRDSLQMPVFTNSVFKASSLRWFLSRIWGGSKSKSFHLGGMCFCCSDISQVSKTVPGFCGPVWVWWRGKGNHMSTGLNLPLPWQGSLTVPPTELIGLYLCTSVISRNTFFFHRRKKWP